MTQHDEQSDLEMASAVPLWTDAFLTYMVVYVVGTVGLGLADPTSNSLFLPALAVAGVAWWVARIPRRTSVGWARTVDRLVPAVAAVVVVVVLVVTG
ncbi:hypothetical protein CLV56_2081 [Mumia flava]|uniref:Uncharacterized protein n=1 Tax=Mumia flava TaxID=1348852 RepID=A0A2M9BIS7_9ACTN|nr:hypothetical protein [Mumia flava]PJJ57843.1 hypothetical protein CLV56_2081 [Mumia flava]